LIFAFLLLPFDFLSATTHYPKPTGYVSDFARVLDQDSRQSLENTLSQFERSTTNEIAVVTVPSLEGDSVEDYANRLFKEWGIGKKGKDNGVLILIAPHDRKMRIEVGYGLEARLTDGIAGQIIRERMTPYFKQSDYISGIFAGVQDIQQVLTNGQRLHSDFGEYRTDNGGLIIGVLLIVFVFLFLSFLNSRRGQRWKRGGFSGWPGGFGDGGFSGGGFSGGGFGSGGFGGGGSFGGFGGGGSGGGGASGGW
jgi:uncharacterized protein